MITAMLKYGSYWKKEVRAELRITLAKVKRIRYHQEVLRCPEAWMPQLGLKLPQETMTNWYIYGALDHYHQNKE